jgi:hypothetical protein
MADNRSDDIQSLNQGVLNADELSPEDLEGVAGGDCTDFTGSCQGFGGSCTRFGIQPQQPSST